jgi:hypothetical protein
MSMLAREGTVRMPTVYGVMTHEEHPGPDVLLIERLRGVPVEAPARTPERWEQLKTRLSRRCWPGIVRIAAACRAGRQHSGKPVAAVVSPAG